MTTRQGKRARVSMCVEIEVDGDPVTIRLHTDGEITKRDLEALKELARALRCEAMRVVGGLPPQQIVNGGMRILGRTA